MQWHSRSFSILPVWPLFNVLIFLPGAYPHHPTQHDSLLLLQSKFFQFCGIKVYPSGKVSSNKIRYDGNTDEPHRNTKPSGISWRILRVEQLGTDGPSNFTIAIHICDRKGFSVFFEEYSG
jgi:hypothetical protein